MSRRPSPSAGRSYGLKRVTAAWKVPRSTVYWRRHAPEGAPSKRGPKGACRDDVLALKARHVIDSTGFHGEGYRKVHRRLHLEGVSASKERVRRVLGQYNLLAPVRAGRPHGPKAHDRRITTDRPDAMWGTDFTTTVTTGEGLAFVFIGVDHCTTECVGIHASLEGHRFEALEPMRQGVLEHFGGYDQGAAQGLVLRHDHGSQYMARDFQRELAFLGIKSSPANVREPQGNGVAERFIKTLKENLLWVRRFETVEELRLALLDFKARYNSSWMVQKHGYLSPAQARLTLITHQNSAA